MITGVSGFITMLYNDFLAYTENEFKKMKLSYGQLPFILYIGNHPGCTPSELREKIQMDWGHCQRSLAKLEKEGFIVKSVNPKNSRSSCLELTELGKEAFTMGHKVFEDWDKELDQILSSDDKEKLIEMLHAIVQRKGGTPKHDTISGN